MDGLIVPVGHLGLFYYHKNTTHKKEAADMTMTQFKNGINLGGWLSQCEFLCRQPPDPNNLHAHWNSFIKREDLARIANWGFDHVRLPVSGYLTKDPALEDHILDCVNWCKEQHLNLILDLHDIPGNVYGAMDHPMPLLTEQDLKENFLNTWKNLAILLRGVTGMNIVFELLNEVSDGSGGYLWNALYQQAIAVIHEVSPERTILVGSNMQNSASCLNELHLLQDPTICYSFHYYDPLCFTHQKAQFSEEMMEFHQTISYPGDMSGFSTFLEAHPQYLKKYVLIANEKTNDLALMEKLLKPAIDFQKYSGHETYCGEFGVVDSAPEGEAVKWISDLLRLLDQHRIGHALWNYKALDFGLLNMDGKLVRRDLLNAVVKKNSR